MRVAAILSVLCLLPHHAFAQAQSKGCFSKAEEAAERLVRQGLRLREGARGCDGSPWNMQTQSMWVDIDRRFGPRFADQTRIRQAAFQREFADDADNRLAVWNGRIVFHFRYYPLSETYCAGIKDLMSQMQKRGWSALTAQANKATVEVKMDYRLCE
jgi:hypothetical protein